MNSHLTTPPPKPMGRHQHSKSATPTASNQYDPPNASNRGNPRRQRSNRNADQNNNNIPLNPPNPADQLMGYSTDTGPVLPHSDLRNGQSTDDAINSDGIASAKPRRGRQRQRRPNGDGAQNIGSPQGQTGDAAKTVHEPIPVQTPAKKQMAYAGPTFHASPAPSALPVPKFFSKSVPASAAPGLQALLDAESDKSLSPPTHEDDDDAATAPEVVEESPLDFFFRADREEKAKRTSGLLTPNSKLDRMDSYDSSSSLPARHGRQASTDSPRGMFALELDGNSVASNAENIKTGHSERLPTHHSNPGPSGIPQQPHRSSNETPDEISQKLKNMLFSLPNPANPFPSPPPERVHVPSEPNSRFHTPSPFYRPSSVPGKVTGPNAALAGNPNAPLHYGNRNLSPLFKAAKNDPSMRSSGLRREVTDPSYHNQQPFINPQPLFANQTHGMPPTQNSPAISGNYADLHMQPHATGSTHSLGHQQPFHSNAGITPELPANQPNTLPYRASSVPGPPAINNGVSSSNAGPPQQPRNQGFVASGPPMDVQSMENDLRRILNLNVIGNGVR